MRELTVPNCNKEFIINCIKNGNKRMDGRGCYDYRNVQIKFGTDRGCCLVVLGKTRVLCNVSAELTPPTETRPTEGIIFLNVELSPMAAPHFEAGRQSETNVELSRILERVIKESRCVDTEALCVMAAIKVWTIRVDLIVLNNDGNLIDCSSIAAIAGLAHFRRPEVTVDDEELVIHAIEDRDPLPLSLHHMPICITTAFYEEGKYLLLDPTDIEEKVMDGKLVIGMNKHREICTFQLTGSINLHQEQILRCSNLSWNKVKETTEKIMTALEDDKVARKKNVPHGFAYANFPGEYMCNEHEEEIVHFHVDEEEINSEIESVIDSGMEDFNDDKSENDVSESEVINMDNGIYHIGEGGPSKWIIDDDVSNGLYNERKDLLECLENSYSDESMDSSTITSDSKSEKHKIYEDSSYKNYIPKLQKTIKNNDLFIDESDSEEETTVSFNSESKMLQSDISNIWDKEKEHKKSSQIDLSSTLKKTIINTKK